MVYLSTDRNRKISHFALISLVFDRLFGYKSGTKTSRALGPLTCQDYVSKAPAGRKAAQIVHKQNKHECAIADNIYTSGTKVEIYDARFTTLFFPIRVWHETL